MSYANAMVKTIHKLFHAIFEHAFMAQLCIYSLKILWVTFISYFLSIHCMKEYNILHLNM